jgi:hypothetical protein
MLTMAAHFFAVFSERIHGLGACSKKVLHFTKKCRIFVNIDVVFL